MPLSYDEIAEIFERFDDIGSGMCPHHERRKPCKTLSVCLEYELKQMSDTKKRHGVLKADNKASDRVRPDVE